MRFLLVQTVHVVFYLFFPSLSSCDGFVIKWKIQIQSVCSYILLYKLSFINIKKNVYGLRRHELLNSVKSGSLTLVSSFFTNNNDHIFPPRLALIYELCDFVCVWFLRRLFCFFVFFNVAPTESKLCLCEIGMKNKRQRFFPLGWFQLQHMVSN